MNMREIVNNLPLITSQTIFRFLVYLTIRYGIQFQIAFNLGFAVTFNYYLTEECNYKLFVTHSIVPLKQHCGRHLEGISFKLIYYSRYLCNIIIPFIITFMNETLDGLTMGKCYDILVQSSNYFFPFLR